MRGSQGVLLELTEALSVECEENPVQFPLSATANRVSCVDVWKVMARAIIQIHGRAQNMELMAGTP
jgi:hypothetical protein